MNGQSGEGSEISRSRSFKKRRKLIITLCWWEQFIVSAALSLLTLLATKVSNAAELAAIQSAMLFLQKLLAGGVSIS
jgi:hypothetical protein